MKETPVVQHPPQTSQQPYEPTQKNYSQYDNPYFNNPLLPPPPPQRRYSSRKRLWLFIGIVTASLLVGGIIGGFIGTAIQKTTPSATQATTQQTPTLAPATNTEAPQPTSTLALQPTPQQHYKVGQTIRVGTVAQGYIWEITIVSAKVDGTQSYLKPGYVFLNFEIAAKNISSREQSIYMYNFELRTINGQRQDLSYDPNAPASLSGKVEAGSPIRGALTYQVPENEHQFQLFFSLDPYAPGQTTWDIRV